MQDNKSQDFGKLIAFIVIFLILLIIASIAINPKKWFDDNRIQDRNARAVQMMEQTPDSIDVLNLGDSLSHFGFTPMELWRQRGYTSFNIGADGILMPEAYYALVEACDKQHPKYLLMEGLPLFRLPTSKDGQIYLSQPLYHRFAFLKYHNLWKSFILGRGNYIYHKGYLVNRTAKRYKPDPNYMDHELKEHELAEIPDYNRKWFSRIRRYCDRRGIKIILYSLPSPKNYNWARVDSIEEFAKEENLPYIDMNKERKSLGIKLKGDYSDRGDHLNLDGAVKVVSYLGKYLNENGTLTDHRQDPAYASWNEELTEYDELVVKMENTSFYGLRQAKKKKEKEEKEKAREEKKKKTKKHKDQ